MEKSNFFAPSALEGIPNDDGKYIETCYTPIFNSGLLSADTEVQNLVLQLDNDADFILHGLQIMAASVPGEVGDAFNFRFNVQDEQNQQIFDAYVDAKVFGTDGYTVPFPIVPGRAVRAGGFLTFSFLLAGGTLQVQIACRGVKRRLKA